jgi:hypothetical protein
MKKFTILLFATLFALSANAQWGFSEGSAATGGVGNAVGEVGNYDLTTGTWIEAVPAANQQFTFAINVTNAAVLAWLAQSPYNTLALQDLRYVDDYGIVVENSKRALRLERQGTSNVYALNISFKQLWSGVVNVTAFTDVVYVHFQIGQASITDGTLWNYNIYGYGNMGIAPVAGTDSPAIACGFEGTPGTCLPSAQNTPCLTEDAVITPTSSWQNAASVNLPSNGMYVYKFSAVAGQNYSFNTCDVGSAAFDTDFYILDSDCETVGYVDYGSECIGDSWAAAMVWACPTSGDYYLAIVGYSEYDYGNFTLAYRLGGTVQQYTITLISNPTAGGTTTGSGTYYEGAVATITATPNAGYSFIGWSFEIGGEIIETAASLSIYADDYVLYANFQLQTVTQYTVTLISNPTAGGTTIGGGTYNEGAFVAMIAMPNAGYDFIGWSFQMGGAIVASAPTIYINGIDNDYILYANFEAAICTENAVITPTSSWQNASGSIAANGKYIYKFSAVAGENYSFNTCDIGSANFDSEFYFYNNNCENIGYVDSGDACFGYSYAAATVWNCPTSGDYYLKIKSYDGTAGNFTLAYRLGEIVTQYTVNIISNPANGGTTTGTGIYNEGAAVTMTAVPNAGFDFIGWSFSIGGEILFTEQIISISSIDDNYVLYANFQSHTSTVTIYASAYPNTTYGSVIGAGEYNLGEQVTLTATPNAGYIFYGWFNFATETYIFDNPLVMTAENNQQYAAVFVLANVVVSATVNPANSGSVTGTGTYPAGSNGIDCTLTAVPNNGYTFVNWAQDGYSFTNTDNPLRITGFYNENISFVANFVPSNTTYTLNITSDPVIGGTTTGSGTYAVNEDAWMTAIPNEGYSFIGWSFAGSDHIASTGNPVYITMTDNYNIVARFAIADANAAELLSLSTSIGDFSPAFAPYISNYYVNIDNSQTSLTVSATSKIAADSIAVLIYNDSEDSWSALAETIGSVVVPVSDIEVGETTIQIQVYKEDYSSYKFYYLFITRAEVSGINEIAENSVVVFPNPAENEFFINSEKEVTNVEIVDITGKSMLSTRSTTVNVSSLPQGIYFARITVDNQIVTKKIIKK